MAVTLTSTGITFSDGTSQTSAALGGGIGNVQYFTSSGTWSNAHSATSAVVFAVGGGGGGGSAAINASDQGYPCARDVGKPGGVGGANWNGVTIPAGTNNLAVTVGNGGNGGSYQNHNCANGGSGNSSALGNLVSAGGGQGGGCYVRYSGNYTYNNVSNGAGNANAWKSTYGSFGNAGSGGCNRSDSGGSGGAGMLIVWS